MAGSARGRIVTPGNPDASRLIRYVESKELDLGSRYARMPFLNDPLSPRQIAILRSWIAEGANNDALGVDSVTIVLPSVRILDPSDPSEDIYCWIPVKAYANIIIRDQATGRLITSKGGAVLPPPSRDWTNLGAATTVGNWLRWSLNRNRDNNAPAERMPDSISITLSIKYAEGDLSGTEFGITRRHDWSTPMPRSAFVPEPVSHARHGRGVFRYRLDADADVDIKIVPEHEARVVWSDQKTDLVAGIKEYPWNLRQSDGTPAVPGTYVARFRARARNTALPVSDVCILLRVAP